MDQQTYQKNRATLFNQIAGLVKDTDGIVLFRQIGSSWTPDTLTAAMPVPSQPHVFFVLGSYHRLPGWDDSVVKVENWKELFNLVAAWVNEMKYKALITTAKELEEKDSIFIEEEDLKSKAPTHVWWIPKHSCFSNASGGMLAREPSVIAPPKAVIYAKSLEDSRK